MAAAKKTEEAKKGSDTKSVEQRLANLEAYVKSAFQIKEIPEAE